MIVTTLQHNLIRFPGSNSGVLWNNKICSTIFGPKNSKQNNKSCCDATSNMLGASATTACPNWSVNNNVHKFYKWTTVFITAPLRFSKGCYFDVIAFSVWVCTFTWNRKLRMEKNQTDVLKKNLQNVVMWTRKNVFKKATVSVYTNIREKKSSSPGQVHLKCQTRIRV